MSWPIDNSDVLLNDDILFEILSHIPVYSVSSCARVCRRFRDVLNLCVFWERFCKKDFSGEFAKESHPSKASRWKEWYFSHLWKSPGVWCISKENTGSINLCCDGRVARVSLSSSWSTTLTSTTLMTHVRSAFGIGLCVHSVGERCGNWYLVDGQTGNLGERQAAGEAKSCFTRGLRELDQLQFYLDVDKRTLRVVLNGVQQKHVTGIHTTGGVSVYAQMYSPITLQLEDAELVLWA